ADDRARVARARLARHGPLRDARGDTDRGLHRVAVARVSRGRHATARADGTHMQEILPGVFHWTARHPRIHIEVSSYWLEDGGVLIDPLVPPQEGLEWFANRPA